MKIVIRTAYDNIPLWAGKEEEIDFENERADADRCTVSFAAWELKTYFEKLIPGAEIGWTEDPCADAVISLELVPGEEEPAGDFSLIPEKNGVTVRSFSREGILGGAYELLHIQGIGFFAPGEEHTYIPKRSELCFPAAERSYHPTMDGGRGFDFEGDLKDSKELWLWMVRNRMNISAYRPNSYAFQRKLGLRFKMGGHIFENLLAPDTLLPDGSTVWESHREWYGVNPDEPLTKENALRTQFCMTNESLIDYLAENIIGRLKTVWRYADRIDVWGFDTWGRTCSCETCRKQGNSSDNTVWFMSRLKKRLEASDLKRKPKLVICAYEGTATLEPPTRPLPENLSEDFVVYYPINRCYHHDFADKTCPVNRRYDECLRGWVEKAGKTKVIIGEYYNVSKYEDLPLVFTGRIPADFRHYAEIGVKGATYMHLPMLHWGMRSLNHLLYSALAWDAHADSEKLITGYFADKYGEDAPVMRENYEKAERAWSYCSTLRSWSEISVLSQLIGWEGTVPEKELISDGHFENHGQLLAMCRSSVETTYEILSSLKALREKRKQKTVSEGAGHAVNPAELRLLLDKNSLADLSEEIRYMTYSLDTLRLTTDMIAYYDALLHGETADVLWEEIEELYDAMDGYYIPLRYENGTPEIRCRDALTRSQLRPVINRCRYHRLSRESEN